MDRKELEAIWEKTHPDLPVEKGNLADAIIAEGLESLDVVGGLYVLAQDIEDFADAVTAQARGER